MENIILNSSQIERIKQWAGNTQCYYEDIRNEIVDHVASKIESEMSEGMPFEESLAKSTEGFSVQKFHRSMVQNQHLTVLQTLGRYLMRSFYTPNVVWLILAAALSFGWWSWLGHVDFKTTNLVLVLTIAAMFFVIAIVKRNVDKDSQKGMVIWRYSLPFATLNTFILVVNMTLLGMSFLNIEPASFSMNVQLVIMTGWWLLVLTFFRMLYANVFKFRYL